jgi:hypothetical protein
MAMAVRAMTAPTSLMLATTMGLMDRSFGITALKRLINQLLKTSAETNLVLP